jgi:predicted RNA binding protein YcfA (HicA-like mRNA interferase family)
MTGLHNLKRSKVVRTFQRLGWEIAREGGGHTIMKNSRKPGMTLVVPRHTVIASGTIRSLLKDAGMDLGEFLDLYSQ